MKGTLVLFLCFFVLNDVVAATPRGRSDRVVNNSGAFVTQIAQLGAPGAYRSGINVKNVTTNVVFSSDNTAGNVAMPVQDNTGVSAPGAVVDVTVAGQDVISTPQKTHQQLQIERQRDICIRNNIGIGNTFVWAARNSNIDNYASMIEDVNVPENNTCFVKVNIDSTDGKINVSDIEGKYFEMGRSVTCGSWVDKEMLKKRILDAKKTARTWGIVGATVGSAAVGVGAMELFGNKMIGGAVQGQKALEGQELILSQLKALKKDNSTEYNRVVRAIRDLHQACDDADVWANAEKPKDCDASENNFLGLLDKLD